MTQTEILRIKAAVRARDGYKCVRCGITNDEHKARHGKQLHVHRVEPGSAYSAAPGVCELLCYACHGPEPKSPPGLQARISATLWNKLRTVRAMRREMGLDFDPVAFIAGIIEQPVAELHLATCDEFCEMHARRKQGT